ncbi:beta-lactamase [Aureococcus anophagefferens]|nr:beta-lactamase [Aureococcus anophagefferens]
MFAGPASMRACARRHGRGASPRGTRAAAAAAAAAARRRAPSPARGARPPQASLPLGFTAFSLANTSSWLAYGVLVLDDPDIWAPNVLGLGSAATQLLLILRFGRTPKSNR